MTTTPPTQPGRLVHPQYRGPRRRGRDPGRILALLGCALLACVGAAPFAFALVVRSAWARTWAVRETERLLRSQGIAAHYQMRLRMLPLSVELSDVRVESNDGGAPALECRRLRIRPKLFALLAGKLAVGDVELDEPNVRLVLRNGAIQNLSLAPRPTPAKEPLAAPFSTISLTEASIDVDADGVRLRAESVDLDVTADETDDGRRAAFETGLRIGSATVVRTRTAPGSATSVDEDALCSLEARVRVQPDGVLVRRLEARGLADLDGEPGTLPVCTRAEEDTRQFSIAVSGGHVFAPRRPGGWPSFDGHLSLRVPIALAERFARVQGLGGWIGLDADVRYEATSVLPEVTGTLEAGDVRLGRYAVAQRLRSVLSIRRDVVESARTTIGFADGTVTLSDLALSPLASGVRLEHVRLDAAGVDFTELLRSLGVHPSPHVGWDIREVHAPRIAGTFAPLRLDGEFTALTYGFGVYDRPAVDPARERVFGFAEAQVSATLAVRPDGVRFANVRAALPRSRVDATSVFLGYHGQLDVDVGHLSADFDDLSPIGSVAFHGRLTARAKVSGATSHPEISGDIQALSDLVVAKVSFGDLSSAHVGVDIDGPELEVSDVHAKRGASAYDVPTARLRFRGAQGFIVDAVGASGALHLRDVLSMFRLEDDPRYDGLDAIAAARADVHVAIGGPEDVCHTGYVSVTGKGRLTDVDVYGEHFARGEADVALRWFDREQGIAGAEIDVRSFVLEKVRPTSASRAAATGTLLGSAVLRRGGALAANVVLEGVPLSRVDALAPWSHEWEGSISGVAHVSGDLDDFHPGAGFTARAGLDLSSTRVRGVALPNSHIDLGFTRLFGPPKTAVAKTFCGAPVSPPFDKAAYLADSSRRDRWTLDGDLLGGTAQLHDIVVTRSNAPRLTGRVSLRGVDLAPLERLFAKHRPDADEPIAFAPATSIGGQIWGELVVDDLPIRDLSKAKARLLLGPIVLSRGGQRIMLKPPRSPLELANDTLTVPPLELSLDTPEGFRGGAVLSGSVTHVSGEPTLALDAQLEPVDLAIVERLVPRIQHAAGSLSGNVHLSGPAVAPSLTGELHADAEAIEIHGLSSALTDVRFEARATPAEVDLSGACKFAGGTIGLTGSMPIHGLSFGALESNVVARGVRLAPADGVAVTLDTDLQVAYDPNARAADSGALPRVTGAVTLTSFAYTRPVSLTNELTTIGGRARRTDVDTYDPALDFVTFDLQLRSREPLVLKNNLVEAQLSIDTGTLEATGTNQRVGLRGALRTLPGGRFHFQQSDFEIRQGLIRFDDPTRVAANVDVTAVTEYRRYTDTSAGTAGGVGAGAGPSADSLGSTRGGSLWRITLHAYGDADDLRVDMTSEPTLSQEDIVLLLTVGMTRTELDHAASSLGTSLALNYLGATTGADRAVKQALPIIDDFRFGSAYSTVTGKTEPQLTIGKRLTNDLRASVTTGVSQDRELRSDIEWRLNNQLSVQGSYDNINDVSSSTLGNIGVDLRWRLEFE